MLTVDFQTNAPPWEAPYSEVYVRYPVRYIIINHQEFANQLTYALSPNQRASILIRCIINRSVKVTDTSSIRKFETSAAVT